MTPAHSHVCPMRSGSGGPARTISISVSPQCFLEGRSRQPSRAEPDGNVEPAKAIESLLETRDELRQGSLPCFGDGAAIPDELGVPGGYLRRPCPQSSVPL